MISAGAVGAQKLQPVQTLLLVRAQLRLHAGGHRYFRQSALPAQLLDHGAQCARTLPHSALAQCGTGAQRVQA